MIFVKGLTPKTLAVDVDLTETVANLRRRIQGSQSINCSVWRVTYAGRQLKDEKTLQECGIEGDCTLHFIARLIGGKGGFGSLLRGAGRAILTDNVDACRDLSGRRLRQANAEKLLAEWAAEARERELEKIALKHVKEQQKATQKEERAQVDSEAVRREQQEALDRVSAAVVAAQEILNGNTLESGKRKAGLSDLQKPSKRARIYGFEDLSSSDSDNESEFEAAAQLSKAGCIAAASSSGEDSEVSAQETALAIAQTKPEAPTSSAPSASQEPAASPAVSRNTAVPVHQQPEAVIDKDPFEAVEHVHASSSHESSAPKAAATAYQEAPPAKSVPASNATPSAAEEVVPIILAAFSSAQQLEGVGLDRLKHELQRHGLKCSGSLADRAARLFLLKSIPLDQLGQQHFSKPTKPKASPIV